LFRSLVRNIKELVNPPKLPPLQVTSKPVAVKDIWDKDENQKTAGVSSLAIHVGVISLMLVLGTNKKVQEKVRNTVVLIAPELAPDLSKVPPAKDKMSGGGGGGDRSPLPASKGRLPKISPRQFTPPMAVVNNPNPKMIMEPSIIIQPDAPVPNVNMAQLGDPWGKIGPPSNGPGSGGGIGSGSGGGVGSGTGPGVGPGRGGGFGGGVYKIGGGVSAPVPLYRPEPEYSEEARKAKFQGTVLLYVEIDEQGKTRNLRVVRPLGLGLDEKALEAVSRWRFKPGMKDGHPVAVGATIEVNFRLL
jgi:TonB family protein